MTERTFTDRHGTVRTLRITGLHHKALKAIGLDVATLKTPESVAEVMRSLEADPENVIEACRIVEGIPENQASEYAEAWNGDTFEAASVALSWAIVDFMPKTPRQAVTSVMEKMQAAQEKAAAKAQQKIQDLVEKLDPDEILNKTFPGL